MVKKGDRVPSWIRKTYHSIISKLSKKEKKPMFYYIDEAISDWLVKNSLINNKEKYDRRKRL